MSRRWGLAPTTVANAVYHVTNAINSRMKCIETPKSAEEWRKVERTFAKKHILRCLGSLDGKHIRIKAPPHSGSLFFNYKHFFSFVLLVVVDADGRVIWVDVGSPGSNNDASIFSDSKLKTILDEEANLPPPTFWSRDFVVKPFVIADGIFKITPRMMTLYGGNGLNISQKVLNKKLSRARVKAEHAFGRLSAKFRILRREMECPYEKSVDIILALCHLHNYLIGKAEDVVNVPIETNMIPYKDGKEQRDYLCRYLNN